ncbi:MAG: site-2 protease family protein [Clostridiales bacterium]|nr:site-2 protease family protein [Clostridiales bacterium]
MLSIIQNLIYTVPAVLIAICFHEFAHGFVSYKLGDPTPKYEGRLSLNPKNHLDPLGTLALILFHFGWAKPVMVNPQYYKNKKLGMVEVALAGPLMNFLIAFLSLLLYGVFLKYAYYIRIPSFLYRYLLTFFVMTTTINLGLGVFNLIPVPPLDGSKVLNSILPADKYFAYMKYENYGQIIILVLLFTGFLTTPLNYFISRMMDGMLNIVAMILGMGV